MLNTLSYTLNQHDTIINFTVQDNTSNIDNYKWHDLSIEIYQKTYKPITTRINFNDITKKDLEKLAEIFNALAREVS